MIIKEFKKDKLSVKIFDNRTNMGIFTAKEFEKYLNELLLKKEKVNIIFAAAPSQLDFLKALRDIKTIDWKRINAFHMDEYVGIGIEQPQSFAGFIDREIVKPLGIVNFYPLNGKAESVEQELERYTKLLKDNPTDIVVCGIGENAHIAFNDPGEANFFDPLTVKVVTLDNVCRQQQVNDKCFPDFDSVPKHAFSLTVPALLRGDAIFCLVPAATKSNAVKLTVEEEINDMVPASIMRVHKKATMYCDSDSGKLVL